jgi:hypothetical protein
MPVLVCFAVMLTGSRAGKADPADSKGISDTETYNYHGTFNYYYPSPTPPAGRQLPPQKPVSSPDFWDWDHVASFSTLVVAIFNAGLFIVTWKAAEAAQRAALAAEKSNRDARELARIELRGYLSVVGISIPHPDDPSPHIRILVKNSGKTPVYNVRIAGGYCDVAVGSLLPDGFTYPTQQAVASTTYPAATTTIPTEGEQLFPLGDYHADRMQLDGSTSTGVSITPTCLTPHRRRTRIFAGVTYLNLLRPDTLLRRIPNTTNLRKRSYFS